MYAALRRAMFLVPPERIHHVVFAALRAATTPRATRHMVARKYSDYDPALASTVFGVRFPAPLGLAAGFDKDGLGANTWGALGFGHAELGTVTPRPQPGNPAPRLFRLPEDRALLNRMGFNNQGASAMVRTLARATPAVPIGINIGKNKTTPPEKAVAITRTARGCSGRWAATSWSTSAHRTHPGCGTCSRSSRCARS